MGVTIAPAYPTQATEKEDTESLSETVLIAMLYRVWHCSLRLSDWDWEWDCHCRAEWVWQQGPGRGKKDAENAVKLTTRATHTGVTISSSIADFSSVFLAFFQCS